MIGSRIRILGIAPYEGMHTAMERVAQTYTDMRMDIYTGDLDAGAAIVKKMEPNGYDCIISRGGTAELIRQVTELPVIEIKISVFDVLASMKLAENYSDRYAVVGFPSVTEPAHILCSLLEYHLDIFTVHSAQEAAGRLEQLKAAGCRMIICDWVTHGAARRMGLNAFLVTSGTESIQAAISQAIEISIWFGRLRQENLFLRGLLQEQDGCAAVLDADGDILYGSTEQLPDGLKETFRVHLREISSGGPMKFYHAERDRLYKVMAQTIQRGGVKYGLFYCTPSRIPLHTHWTGIRFMDRGECEHLFTNSFYGIGGGLGMMDAKIKSFAAVRQPVMIMGEPGTEQEQIARFLYLHSPSANHPFILADCGQMNEKSWDFLLDHHSSPLNETGNTIFFQNFEEMPQQRVSQLLSAVLETGLVRRVRLLFSCMCSEGERVSERICCIRDGLGCLVLELPPLRNRFDEIPALASLCLDNLNLEMGRQISGFEPRAMEMLCQYDWPDNYTQFRYILQMLAVQTDSVYIRSSLVAELLAKERMQHRPRGADMSKMPRPGNRNVRPRTLEEIIGEAILEALEENQGNRAAAARQLRISRTTLWRYLASHPTDQP